MWRFTKHFRLRMSERGYSEFEVLSVLNGIVAVIIQPSRQDTEVHLYYGKVGLKYMMIAVNKETRSLITVRGMRKKEKEIFHKETGDG